MKHNVYASWIYDMSAFLRFSPIFYVNYNSCKTYTLYEEPIKGIIFFHAFFTSQIVIYPGFDKTNVCILGNIKNTLKNTVYYTKIYLGIS